MPDLQTENLADLDGGIGYIFFLFAGLCLAIHLDYYQ